MVEAAVAARRPGVGASAEPFVCGFKPVNCALGWGEHRGRLVGGLGILRRPERGVAERG